MILLGVFSSMLAAAISIRALIFKGIKTDTEYFLLGLYPLRIVPYFFWILKEIILAAWDVSKTIVFHQDQIDSAFVRFKADYDNPVARSTLTDSITLTPGTITVNVDADGIYTVHGLTQAARDSLLEGTMQKKVAWTFGEEIDYQPLEARVTKIEMPEARPHERYRVKRKKKFKQL